MPALTFHPETLQSTKALRVLVLRYHDILDHFVAVETEYSLPDAALTSRSRAIPRYVYHVPTEAKCLLETAPRERGQDITVDDGSGDAHGNSAPTTAACWLHDLPEPCVRTLTLDELDRILIYLRYKYSKMASKASNVRR
ncbi:hypothetical protein MVEG_01603 [Podila verticillata NRRL 6337]|nr:hypothetical protein MVEG_01603 [Podila verticillata NRRL 6337]